MIEVKIVRRKRRGQAKGWRYSLRWLGSDGRHRYEAAGTDRVLAESQREAKQAELNGQPRLRRMTWNDFVEAEEAALTGTLEPDSVAQVMRTLTRFAEICDPILLDQVDVTMVELFRQRRLEGETSSATVNKDLRNLKASFNRALARGHLIVNPCVQIKQTRLPQKDLRILTDDEEMRLLAMCSDPLMRTFVMTALDTGARLGELLALEWADVDLRTGRVYIRCKETWRTKSKRNRWVRVENGALEALRELNKDSASRHPFRPEKVGKGYRQAFLRRFKRVVKAAQIDDCTIHDLRRTCLTRLAEAGIPPATLQAYAGHAHTRTTMEYYVRLDADKVLESVAAARALSIAANPPLIHNGQFDHPACG